ncbi:MAG: hypothetical protein JNL82_41190 [Myxococcales bacterium]|nr:hypothetical protein [Myxococcales bacterium]
MSAPRLISVVVLLLSACAAWDSAAPSNTPPPADGPAPSHYAPPPPGDPRALPPVDPPQPQADLKVAFASVLLQEDCAEPAPAAAPAMPAPVTPAPGAASQAKPVLMNEKAAAGAPAAMSQRYAGDTADGRPWQPPCFQSLVQLSVQSEVAGKFAVTAVRVIDPASQRVVGSSTFRGPTLWSDAGGYTAWDERTVAGRELKVSYKLGALDISPDRAGPGFSAFMGPFMLEIDVLVDGVRRTVRSAEFSREPPHVIVT